LNEGTSPTRVCARTIHFQKQARTRGPGNFDAHSAAAAASMAAHSSAMATGRQWGRALAAKQHLLEPDLYLGHWA